MSEKKSWRDFYKVHPAADVFPMLPEDELREAWRGHQEQRAQGTRSLSPGFSGGTIDLSRIHDPDVYISMGATDCGHEWSCWTSYKACVWLLRLSFRWCWQ